MLLFDDVCRPDEGSPHPGETNFAYLNRSGRPEACRVRTLVEEWLTIYPASGRDAVVARLRASDNNMHASAFFELLMCVLMMARGHRVIEVEPKLPHTRKSPDFLMETNEGQRFYLECTVATGRSDQEAAADNRLNPALRVIDEIDSLHHFLDLSIEGAPTASLSTSRLKRQLATWLAGLPQTENVFEEAAFEFEEHSVKIVIRPWHRQHPERPTRSIGIRHFPVVSVTPDQDVRGALKRKATRYGALNQPYIVAVNALERFADQNAAVDALFGTPATVDRLGRDGRVTTEHGRLCDGLWHGRTQPQRTGLSGVISMQGVDPWNFARREPRLILNPWAAQPLPPLDLGIRLIQFEDGVRKDAIGSTFGQVFDLPESWPEETADLQS